MSKVRTKPNRDSRLLLDAVAYLYRRLRGRKLLAMLSCFGLMLVGGWLTSVPAIVTGQLVDRLSGSGSRSINAIIGLFVFIAAAILGRELVTLVRKYIVEGIATTLERDEFVRVIDHLLAMDLRYMVGEQVGAIQLKINRSIEGVSKLVKLAFMDLLPTLTVAAVAMYVTAIRDWRVFCIMMGAATFGILITAAQIKSQKGVRVALFRSKEGIAGKIVELFFGIDYVRAVGARGKEVDSAGLLASQLRETEFRHHKFMMSFDFGKQLVEGLGFLSVIGVSAWLSLQGRLSTGEIVAFGVLYTSFAAPLRELHRIIDEGFEASLRIGDLNQIYAVPRDEGLSGNVSIVAPSAKTGAAVIEFRDVVVEGLDQDGLVHNLLNGVSVQISRGSTVGIVGFSGAGKSTFARVTLGLIPHYKGSAQILGQEIYSADKQDLARLTSYVPQVPFIVKGTVRENVNYGLDKPADDQAVAQALERARIEESLLRRLGGLDGQVAEGGRNLSGGERQRLVLSRVFVRRAPIVILDEATAALDPKNEALVQEAIDGIADGRTTTLIIAHRLSTLRNVDRILVFENGRIVQDGTFTDLSSNKGVFHDLVKMQEALRPAMVAARGCESRA